MEHSLHTLLPTDWGTEQPGTIRELIDAEYGTLSPTARALRAMVVDVIHGFEREPVTTAAACRELIERKHLPARKNRWDLVALNDRRERIYVNAGGNSGSGRLRMLAVPSRERFPTAEQATTSAPLPKDGGYLAIFGGPVDILTDGDTFARFAKFAAEHRVIDVVCWDERDDAALFWSVAAGVGANGSKELEFPDLPVLNEWRHLLCTN